MALADIFHHVETLEGSAWDEVQELAASGDQSLVGPVQAALERYLDDEDFVGRNLMAMDVRQTRSARWRASRTTGGPTS